MYSFSFTELRLLQARNWGFPAAQLVKHQPTNAGDVRDALSIPGLERSPGGGHGNPVQYSFLENSMDRGAWWAAVHGVARVSTIDCTCAHTHTHARNHALFWVYPWQINNKHSVTWLCVSWMKQKRYIEKGEEGCVQMVEDLHSHSKEDVWILLWLVSSEAFLRTK